MPSVASSTPLTPVEYQQIANDLAQVPGVVWTDYVGDPYGTIYIDVGSAVRREGA